MSGLLDKLYKRCCAPFPTPPARASKQEGEGQEETRVVTARWEVVGGGGIWRRRRDVRSGGEEEEGKGHAISPVLLRAHHASTLKCNCMFTLIFFHFVILSLITSPRDFTLGLWIFTSILTVG